MADPSLEKGVGKSFQNSTMSPLKKIAARFLGILKRRQWLGLRQILPESWVFPKLFQAEDIPAISRQYVRQCHGNMAQEPRSAQGGIDESHSYQHRGVELLHGTMYEDLLFIGKAVQDHDPVQTLIQVSAVLFHDHADGTFHRIA